MTPFKATLKKWGNGLAVMVPAKVAQSEHIKKGATLRVTIQRTPSYTLEELLADYKPEHRHGEADFGAPVGNEAW